MNKTSEQNFGKIKFFNETKGFGFITQQDRTDMFFHINDWPKNSQLPKKDMEVSYDTELGKNKKLKATNINIM